MYDQLTDSGYTWRSVERYSSDRIPIESEDWLPEHEDEDNDDEEDSNTTTKDIFLDDTAPGDVGC